MSNEGTPGNQSGHPPRGSGQRLFSSGYGKGCDHLLQKLQGLQKSFKLTLSTKLPKHCLQLFGGGASSKTLGRCLAALGRTWSLEPCRAAAPLSSLPGLPVLAGTASSMALPVLVGTASWVALPVLVDVGRRLPCV